MGQVLKITETPIFSRTHYWCWWQLPPGVVGSRRGREKRPPTCGGRATRQRRARWTAEGIRKWTRNVTSNGGRAPDPGAHPSPTSPHPAPSDTLPPVPQAHPLILPPYPPDLPPARPPAHFHGLHIRIPTASLRSLPDTPIHATSSIAGPISQSSKSAPNSDTLVTPYQHQKLSPLPGVTLTRLGSGKGGPGGVEWELRYASVRTTMITIRGNRAMWYPTSCAVSSP